MSHFIMVPTNENGIFFDPSLSGVMDDAVADKPFGFRDFFVYLHGWGNDGDQAMVTYSRFSVELARQLLFLQAATPTLPVGPAQALGVGVHWPSEITEDPNSALNDAQLFTFYTMEHRADAVGKNAVYTILRKLLSARSPGSELATRILLLGHSFGCKAICSALQDLQIDIHGGTIPVDPRTVFRVVLIEPATDNDNLEHGDIYGDVSTIDNLRMLITKSAADIALNKWYPLAGRAVNLFNPRSALGATGPTAATSLEFGGCINIDVETSFQAASMARVVGHLVVANLTPVHEARLALGLFKGGGFAGSHSDIYFSEMYNLVAGFLFS